MPTAPTAVAPARAMSEIAPRRAPNDDTIPDVELPRETSGVRRRSEIARISLAKARVPKPPPVPSELRRPAPSVPPPVPADARKRKSAPPAPPPPNARKISVPPPPPRASLTPPVAAPAARTSAPPAPALAALRVLRGGKASTLRKVSNREPTEKFLTLAKSEPPLSAARPAIRELTQPFPLARIAEPAPIPLACERDATPTVGPDPILLAAASPFVHESPDEDLLAPYRLSPLRLIAKMWAGH